MHILCTGHGGATYDTDGCGGGVVGIGYTQERYSVVWCGRSANVHRLLIRLGNDICTVPNRVYTMIVDMTCMYIDR